MDSRARLTVPDVLFVAANLAAFGALYPPYMTFIQDNAGQMTTAELYMYQLVGPFMILMLFTVVWAKATKGVKA